MGKTNFKALIAAALVGLTALTLAVPANAGGRGHGGHGGYGRGGYGGHHSYHHYHHDNGFSAVGAGLLGFGVGAIVGSALTPREVYVAPAPPPPPRYVGYRPAPWTPDWYSYCYSRYRSFNPNTGTFLGYDGYEHFCR
jgi:hypothetical protein